MKRPAHRYEYKLADGYSAAASAFAAGLRPTPQVDVDAWADDKRRLPSKGASEPGKWSTDRIPFLREIMREASPSSPVQRIVFMKSAQTGGTEVLLNAVGHTIDTLKVPAMLVQPTIDLAERFSKQRLAAMIEDCYTLREKIAPARSRDSGNTTLLKEWPGGVLVISGANSAASLRSMPARLIFMDEVDAYPRDLDGEGDPIELAEARARTFPRRKIVLVSTPTIKSLSAIYKEWLGSDQRRYHVPCPHCGHRQVLRWDRLHWPEGEPEQAHYLCEAEACGQPIHEHHKAVMLERGAWVAGMPGAKAAGFHINALYTPIGLGLSWPELAQKWEDIKRIPEKVKTFVNTLLGECFDDPNEKLDADELRARAESHTTRSIPRGCLLLTGGVDVQKRYFACQIVGFGRDGQMWPIDYVEIPADPTRPEEWKKVADYFAQSLPNALGIPMRVQSVGVDTGYLTDDVLHFVRTRRGRFIGLKGASTPGRPIIGRSNPVDFTWRGQVIKSGAQLFTVGVDTAKHTLFARLAADRERLPLDRLIHFPQGLDESYYQQLTAEIWDPNKRRWVKIRARNEALDTLIYAVAAAYQPAIRVQAWKEPTWARLAAALEPEHADLFAALASAEAAPAQGDAAAAHAATLPDQPPPDELPAEPRPAPEPEPASPVAAPGQAARPAANQPTEADAAGAQSAFLALVAAARQRRRA